jgi:very-short-patch-repair endonuclease
VGLADVLLHALRCRPLFDAAVMVESAVRRGDIALSFLFEHLTGDRNGKARTALLQVTGCAESPIEVVARLLFVAADFHVETQVYIEGVGRVDFLLDGFLVVEIDGAAYHSDRKALRRDHRRNNTTLLNGYLILRYGYEDVMFEQEAMLDQIRLALRRGRPPRN